MEAEPLAVAQFRPTSVISQEPQPIGSRCYGESIVAGRVIYAQAAPGQSDGFSFCLAKDQPFFSQAETIMSGCGVINLESVATEAKGCCAAIVAHSQIVFTQDKPLRSLDDLAAAACDSVLGLLPWVIKNDLAHGIY